MIRFDVQGNLLGCCVIQSIVDAVAWAGTELAAASTAAATATTATAEAAGVGAETAATVGSVVGPAVVGAGEGAALGAGVSALTGGDPLRGAELGGLTAGVTSGIAGGIGGVGGAVPGGGTASAAGTAAPASVGTTGADVTTLDNLSVGAAGPTETAAPQLASVETTNLAPAASGLAPNAGGASLPGSVGQGAASGALSSSQGVNAIGANTPIDPAATPPGPSLGPSTTALAPAVAGASTAATPQATVSPTGGIPTNTGIGELAGVAPYSGPAVPGTTDASSLDSIMKYAPVGVSVLGLGADAIMGSQHPPGYAALAGEAAAARNQGAQLTSYAMSGTLPPGMNQALQTAASNVATQIKATYAHSGQSGSSAEAQDIANLQLRVQKEGADIAQSLLQSGIEETKLSQAIYGELMQTAIQQDQMLAQGIGNFATALASMGRPVYQVSA